MVDLVYLGLRDKKGNNCCDRMSSSNGLLVVVVCIVMFNDSLLLTLIDPILPKMLLRIDELKPNRSVETNKTSTSDANLHTGILNNRTLSHDLNYGGKFGYLVAAKGAAQFVCNPFVGHVVTRFGYRTPMTFGSILLAGSTLAFAYSTSYWMLMITRLFQGLASSLTAVTGIVAATFKDDTERGKVVGYAFGGLSIGIIVGPIYGSVLYDFVSPEFPFQLLTGLIVLSMGIQICSYRKERKPKNQSSTEIFKLAKDPYILIVAVNIFLLNLDVSVVLAFLPLQLMELSDPQVWELGIIVLPTSIGYLLSGVIFPRLIKFYPRWAQGLTGMFVSAGTLMALAFSQTFWDLLIVTTFLGLAVGIISTSMQPIFANLVDIRHNEVYGNVYAISDMAVCLSMFVGPMVGGLVLYAYGFQILVFGAAVLDLLSAPLCLFLRNPPRKYSKFSSDYEKTTSTIDMDNNYSSPSGVISDVLPYDYDETSTLLKD